MPELSYLMVLAAVVLTLAGILVLRQAWKKKGARDLRLVATGWALIAFSFVPWVSTSTPDWGSAVALCALMTVGLGAIAYAAWRQPESRKAQKARTKERAVRGQSDGVKRPLDLKAGMRRTLTFLLAGPIAGVASLYLTLFLYGVLQQSNPQGQVFAALFAFPLFWAVLSVFATYDMPALRRGGIVCLSGVLGVVGTYLVS
ncbi:hypothetical protein [Kordiimonas sp.]|uniref:hypothetical protein n=1 Tax=Kordiimonas sp. TaxID=1970157 RepID=UPI003A8FF094